MKFSKTKRIICFVIAFLMVIAMIVPAFAETQTSVEKTENTSETYDEDTDTVIKEHEENVHITITEKDEEELPYKKRDYVEEPGREETAFDHYIDFDELLKKERGSTYKYTGEQEFEVVIDESGAVVTIIIHHSKGQTESEEYFVYDEHGNRVSSGVKYSPNEMEVRIYNVQAGSRYTIRTKNEGMDGVYITQSSKGEYKVPGTGYIPSALDDFGLFDSQKEVNRSIRVKDNISLEQMEYLLATYPLIPTDSLLKRDGVASAFVRAQEEYGVSALALLAIGCLESAYGTSRIARNKQNLFGWGAVDSNPYNGAWDWSANSTSDAIFKALSLICENYPNGKYGQDSFYSMRYNNNVHQYCTSTTWPYSNTKIRAQFENYLGLR